MLSLSYAASRSPRRGPVGRHPPTTPPGRADRVSVSKRALQCIATTVDKSVRGPIFSARWSSIKCLFGLDAGALTKLHVLQ